MSQSVDQYRFARHVCMCRSCTCVSAWSARTGQHASSSACLVLQQPTAIAPASCQHTRNSAGKVVDQVKAESNTSLYFGIGGPPPAQQRCALASVTRRPSGLTAAAITVQSLDAPWIKNTAAPARVGMTPGILTQASPEPLQRNGYTPRLERARHRALACE